MKVFLQDLFLAILNMSITASYVILFVLLIRLTLKKAPKIFSYCLWGVVLFRLVCPFSFSSAFSLLTLLKGNGMEILPGNTGLFTEPKAQEGIYVLPQGNGGTLPAINGATLGSTFESYNPMDRVLFIISLIWAIGFIALFLYSILSYLILRRKVSRAVKVEGNIYECEGIQSPFVLGTIKPRIYLPTAFPISERGYILRHEETHIKRFDYIIKPLAFLVLGMHWFNPLAWISFILMSRDMEMSCDENVIRSMGSSIKGAYSSSLLSLAAGRKTIGGSPLAFGESNTKSRIKNVLSYKKPAFWAVATGVIVIAVIFLGLMTNPRKDKTALALTSIDKTVSASLEKTSLLIRGNGRGGTVILGSKFGKWLEEAAAEWKPIEIPAYKKPVPAWTIYINIANEHQVSFCEAQSGLAMILYNGEYNYYKIPNEDYDEITMMSGISSYFIPGEVLDAVTEGRRTNKRSINDIPNGGDCKRITLADESFYLYEKNGKYYCEKPYEFINEITEEAYKWAVEFAEVQPSLKAVEQSKASSQIEENILEILSSPLESSNPKDYILANKKAYESILKGGEDSLSYMLSQFAQGNAKGLKGEIMRLLCIEILGERNNVVDETLTPEEWFSRLEIKKEVGLPNFAYKGNDPIEKLVYETELEKHKGTRGGFTIVAPHIFGSYEEGNRLRVFVTTFSSQYILYDKTLSNEGGAIIPAAITYLKNPDGSYTLEKYEQAKDGTYFSPSIREYCITPVTRKKINGLADKILNHYGDYKDIIELERKNLIEHLKANNQYGVSLYQKLYHESEKLIPLT